jgi:hypothetical protein
MFYIITLKSLEIIILLNLFLQWKHIMNESFQVYNDLHEPPFFLICQNIWSYRFNEPNPISLWPNSTLFHISRIVIISLASKIVLLHFHTSFSCSAWHPRCYKWTITGNNKDHISHYCRHVVFIWLRHVNQQAS